MAPIPRLKPYAGPALFSYGFRPFFLFGALHAGAMILVWMPVFAGAFAMPTAFSPRDWHVHEMLYGYLPAIVTGFLLTAIPNWTGRLPLQGAPLMLLLGAWLAGRVVVTVSAATGWLAALAVDGGFLLLVGAAAAREVMAGGNRSNLRVVLLVGLLASGNIAFHLEAHFAGTADYSIRVGLAAAIMLIMLIGGRIVPSFTHNWLARENPGRLPIPFGRFDALAIATGAAALVLWVTHAQATVTALALLAAGALHTVRLARWAGDRTLRERLVLVLHLAYAFVPLGFLLTGMAALDVVPAAAGIHAFAGGAIGTMTLAVMTRASLGHTGRALIASPATQAIYACVLAAALSRIAAACHPAQAMALLTLAAALWSAAFLGFGAVYAPVLLRARRA